MYVEWRIKQFVCKDKSNLEDVANFLSPENVCSISVAFLGREEEELDLYFSIDFADILTEFVN